LANISANPIQDVDKTRLFGLTSDREAAPSFRDTRRRRILTLCLPAWADMSLRRGSPLRSPGFVVLGWLVLFSVQLSQVGRQSYSGPRLLGRLFSRSQRPAALDVEIRPVPTPPFAGRSVVGSLGRLPARPVTQLPRLPALACRAGAPAKRSAVLPVCALFSCLFAGLSDVVAFLRGHKSVLARKRKDKIRDGDPTPK
jgi:hypothetical protein